MENVTVEGEVSFTLTLHQTMWLRKRMLLNHKNDTEEDENLRKDFFESLPALDEILG